MPTPMDLVQIKLALRLRLKRLRLKLGLPTSYASACGQLSYFEPATPAWESEDRSVKSQDRRNSKYSLGRRYGL